MKRKDNITKALAVTGLILALLPLILTLLTGAVVSVQAGAWRLDWLMPAELSPLGLAGGFLLFLAAWRTHRRRGLIGWGLMAALALLVGSQGLAVVTGLASGQTEPTGWPVVMVTAALAGYVLALLELDAEGWLLVRELFSHEGSSPAAMPH